MVRTTHSFRLNQVTTCYQGFSGGSNGPCYQPHEVTMQQEDMVYQRGFPIVLRKSFSTTANAIDNPNSFSQVALLSDFIIWSVLGGGILLALPNIWKKNSQVSKKRKK